MSERIEVCLLGPVELRVGGRPVPLTSSAQRALVAVLAMSPGRPVPTAELVDALWDDSPPRNAQGSLQSHVSRLRRLTGADGVTSGAGGYRLRIEPDDVDVARVESLARRGRTAADRDPADGAPLFAEALSVWRGEPLADLPDSLAFAPSRARLREWRHSLEEEWFELRLDAGEARATLPRLTEVAAADQLRERPQLLLMRALHQVGRTPEALQVAESYRRHTAEDTGLDPSPALEELQRRILRDDQTLHPTGPAPPGRVRHRGPPADLFVGRATELELLEEGLGTRRVVTVVGPGGIGKTRLVLEFLERRRDRPDPVHVVELGDTSPDADLVSTVAVAVGLRSAQRGVENALADVLAAGACLLVLDSCEHLLAGVGRLVETLQRRCPRLDVLATSRQRLAVPGELVLRLGPLTEEEQVRLFCDRASLLRPGLDESAGYRALAADICRLVDGLPLAVELAAGREAVFGLPQLRERLSAGLDVLEPSGTADRATAVGATVEWSYRLLDPDTQHLFDRLSVCAGGFTMAAVEHLAPRGTTHASARLSELVEASLVVPDLDSDPARYRLLEVMRRIGLSHLAPTTLEEVRSAHARWAQEFVEGMFDGMRADSTVPTAELGQELPNLRVALAWLIESDQPARAAAIGILLALVATHDTHLDLCVLLRRLEPSGDGWTPEQCQSAVAAGLAACLYGDNEDAARLLSAALDRVPATDDQRWIGLFGRLMNGVFMGDLAGVESDARALLEDPQAPVSIVAGGVCAAALINLFSGHRGAAEDWLERHRSLLDRASRSEGFVHYTRGELAAELDPVAALTLFERARRTCAAHGHTYHREVAAIGRAAVLIRMGRHDVATSSCLELVHSLRHMGMWPQVWIVLRLAAELLVALGDVEPAAVLLAAGEADPLAPPVMGSDRDRLDSVWDSIAARVTATRLTELRMDASGLAGHVAAAELGVEALRAHLEAP